jgi:hypothetical protein
MEGMTMITVTITGMPTDEECMENVQSLLRDAYERYGSVAEANAITVVEEVVRSNSTYVFGPVRPDGVLVHHRTCQHVRPEYRECPPEVVTFIKAMWQAYRYGEERAVGLCVHCFSEVNVS